MNEVPAPAPAPAPAPGLLQAIRTFSPATFAGFALLVLFAVFTRIDTCVTPSNRYSTGSSSVTMLPCADWSSASTA